MNIKNVQLSQRNHRIKLDSNDSNYKQPFMDIIQVNQHPSPSQKLEDFVEAKFYCMHAIDDSS